MKLGWTSDIPPIVATISANAEPFLGLAFLRRVCRPGPRRNCILTRIRRDNANAGRTGIDFVPSRWPRKPAICQGNRVKADRSGLSVIARSELTLGSSLRACVAISIAVLSGHGRSLRSARNDRDIRSGESSSRIHPIALPSAFIPFDACASAFTLQGV